MRTRNTLVLFFSSIILLSATSLVGCGSMELTSIWRDRAVTVDGADADWQNAMTYVDKKNLAIGLLNDESYMYICVASIDSRRVRQMIMSGLTVWFDPHGGKEKTFGINFPLGMEISRTDMNRENMPMPMSGESMPDPEKLHQILEESAKEMVILGPGKGEQRRMPVSGSQEIKVKLGYSGGKLVYELCVPLRRDAQHPDAIGVASSEVIDIGFETAELDMKMIRDRMRDRMGGGMPPGGQGMPPGGQGMHGGRMRGGRMPGGGKPERLELWTKVELATESKQLSQ